MKREDFLKVLSETTEHIEKLFTYKNKSYGTDKDLFHNFRSTATRVLQNEDMFKVLACYVDKHWVALCNKGLRDPEFIERCQDIIVYMLLAITMHNYTGDGADE